MIDLGNRIDFLFDLSRNQIFHINRRVTRIKHPYIDGGLLYFRIAVFGQVLVSDYSHHHDDEGEEEDHHVILQ